MSTPVRRAVGTRGSIVRFTALQRTTHWTVAALMGVLLVTGADLYFGSLFGVVLARHTIEEIHLWCGLALPVPVIVAVAGPWGRAMREDVRRVSRWSRDEIHWLRASGRHALRTGKFNPGQKLNAIYIGATIVIMLATGSMMQWFRFFPVEMRTNATFVHDVFALTTFVVVVGHVLFALTHREALRSMLTGKVRAGWASVHAPGWVDELAASDAARPAP